MANKSGVGTFVNEEFELATDSLDLFSVPSVEQAQISGRTQTYYLHGHINDAGPYEIIMPNDSNEYTQLDSIRLCGEVEVVKADNTDLADADVVSVVNNFPQTLFRQVEVYLNNTCVNDLSTPTYPYKAYLENHLSYDRDVKLTTLRAREMYIADGVGTEESVADAIKLATGGIKLRSVLIKGKKVFFDMKLHIDFLQSRRHLIPGVEMKFKFIRNDDKFSLLAAAAGPKIKIHHLELTARKIVIDPVVANAIETKLSSTPVCYPIAHSKIKNFLLNANTQSQHVAQIYRGKLPRSFIMCMVPAKAYDGDITSNPFVFKHFDLNYFNVFINGDPIHPKAIQPKWDDGSCLKQYSWMLYNIGLHQNASNAITFEDFKSNSVFFPYDLTPDLCNSYYAHGVENGTIDVSLAFKNPIPANVMLLFFATFDEAVVIDKARNVTLA